MNLNISEIRKQAERDSRTFAGDISSLEINLQYILSDHETQTGTKSKIKEDKIQDLESELAENKNTITLLKEEITGKELELTQKQTDYKEAEKNLDHQKGGKFLITIFCIVLFTLGGFLWVFYSSALYSIYVRNIEDEISEQTQNSQPGAGFEKATTLTQVYISIISFDALRRILSKEDTSERIIGILFLIVSTAPLFGATLLIYIFREQGWKNRWIVVVYLGTLIFDVVIAIHIIRSIQQARQNMYVDEAANQFWGIDTSVNFLIIMLTGFVGYVMFGFIFDYFITVYDKSSAKRKLKQRFENDFNLLKGKVRELREQISAEERKKIKNENNLTKLKNNVNVDEKLLSQEITAYIIGWLQYIHSDEHKKIFPNIDIEKLSIDCRNLQNQFLESIKKDYGPNGNERI